MPLETGHIISVFRNNGRATVRLGLFKVELPLGSDRYQCRPIYIAPLHKQELANGQLHPQQLRVSLRIVEEDLISYIQESNGVA
ncbi:hypothetical protein D3C72_2057630 [compost metagenome]